MTAPVRGRRVASAALIAWEREADAVRAEYRRRERQATGSGDLWLAQRTNLLRQVRVAEGSDTDPAGTTTVGRSAHPSSAGLHSLSGDTPTPASGTPQRAHARARTRERWPLSTRRGGD